MRAGLTAALVGLVVVAGCGGSSTSSVATVTPSKKFPIQTILVTLAGSKLTQPTRNVRVKVGQDVRLVVTSPGKDELRLHTDPSRTFKVSKGAGQIFDFAIGGAGTIDLEAREAGSSVVRVVVLK